MKKSILLVLTLLSLILSSLKIKAQSFEKDWKGFYGENWVIKFENDTNNAREFLNVKSSKILSFTKKNIHVEYLFFSKKNTLS